MQTIFEFSPGNGRDTGVTYRNFHEPEEDFAWTRSAWGEVEFGLKGFRAPKWSRGILEVDLDVFRPPSSKADEGSDCFVYVNGLLAGCLHLMERTAMVLPLPVINLSEAFNRVTLQIDRAARPQDFGVSDTRLLGVQFFRLKLAAE